MSRLASVSDYEREIRTVEALIAEEESLAEAHGASLSSELVLENLRARREELRRELMALGDEGLPGQELSITVTGTPVSEDTIEAEFLGSILHDVQKLVRSLVAGQYGITRREGPWEPEVRRRSTLRFAETFTGSFGMTLEAVDEQLELEGHLAVQPAFEELFDVLSSNVEGGRFLESLAPLTPRARSHLRRFLDHISRAGANVSFSWPVVTGRKSADVSARKANTLVQALQRIDENSEA